ncbi:MAG: glycosyl hydrolase, partial [Pyrinomonadaceae bacterium]
LWISPKESRRMINGNDGGSNVSNDGGRTWTEQDQPTAQFYRVATDNDFPYNIYGAQQDNSTMRIASRSDGFAITTNNWFAVGGGESGWIAPHPENSNVIFAGSYDGLLTKYDRRTGQERNIDVYPDNPMGSGADGMKYRFQWNFPIIFSPHKTDGKYGLYTAANILFRSFDEGQSWQPISPDLTRDDKSKQVSSGGPISQDNTSVEYYNTIFSVEESAVKAGVIWAGTDDGLIQVTQDNGKTWSNVTPKDLPEWIQINEITASPFEAGGAYFAATNYKNDDVRPYLYKTTDFGRSWTKIVNGIPADHFTRTIVEDPNKRGFLYAGTERGVYYSANDGQSWQSLQLNLPIVPITDLTVHKREKDLVIATQGRSFYVLDNLPVLYQLADAEKAAAFLFKPEDPYRTAGGGGGNLPPTATVGRNPQPGVVVNYYLKDKPAKDIKIDFLDAGGKVLRSFTGRVEAAGGSAAPGGGPGGFGGGNPQVPLEIGLNTFAWNFRLPNATTLPGLIMWGGSLAGPRIPPGSYQTRLTVDGKVIGTEGFTVRADPRLSTTQEDFAKQYDLMVRINAKLSETHRSILEIRDLRTQLEAVSRRLKSPEQKDLIDKAGNIVKRLTEIEETLFQTKIRSGQDALNYPIRLNNKLAALSSFIDGSDDPPTASAYVVFADLSAKIDAELAKLSAVKSTDIADFNKQYSANGLPVVTISR